jgi:hypothetical protein
MLAGSFASAYYAAPPTTQDIDLVNAATADQLRTFVQLLSEGSVLCRLGCFARSSQAPILIQRG